MSTHNICFSLEIRKILCGYPLLSVAMHNIHFHEEMRKIFIWVIWSYIVIVKQLW